MQTTQNTDHATDNRPTRDDQSPQTDTAGSSANVKAPFAPHENDDSALGDTDQHSTA